MLAILVLSVIAIVIAGLFFTLPSTEPVWPKGHIHEYDPTGHYTYKHQNPNFIDKT